MTPHTHPRSSASSNRAPPPATSPPAAPSTSTTSATSGTTWVRPSLYDDDQLELSHQMITFWDHFTATGDPNGSGTLNWPKYRTRAGELMSLKACDTAPSSALPPAACSKATRGFAEEHDLDFWGASGHRVVDTRLRPPRARRLVEYAAHRGGRLPYGGAQPVVGRAGGRRDRKRPPP
ncbi:carboxylesterase family protein [Streptomyces sp. L7]